MRKYQHLCEKDPEFVFDTKPFEVLVKRSFGSITFIHNVPIHTSKLLPVSKTRKSDEYNNNELQDLVTWLTGGPNGDRSEETDTYGIVQLSVDLDVGSALVDIAGIAEGRTEEAEKKAHKTFKELQSQLVEETKESLKTARNLADERVKRAMRVTNQNLRKQYETLRTEGKGIYTPSVAEALGAYVLAEEVKLLDENRRRMLKMFDDQIKETNTLDGQRSN